MNPLIISRLIESGYQVYLPIGGSSSELIVKNQEGILRTCRAQTASVDGDNSPILKVSGKADITAVVDVRTRNVWIIPTAEIEESTAIRLGKKWDDCLIPEPTSIEFKDRKKMRSGYLEELRKKAMNMGKKGEQNGT